MATHSYAVLDGHLDPMDVARTLVAAYGARSMRIALDGLSRDSFRLLFEEAVKPEQMHLRPHQRRGLQRDVSMLTNGYGSADHADLTTEPSTSVLLGWNYGDEVAILRALVDHYGGWIMRYDDEAWTRYDRVAKAA
jgi:hypothetical protein